jgi:HEAT repeat protein
MLAGLHARLDAYRQARASSFTPRELEAALRDPRWEVRCAAVGHLDASSPRTLVELALDDEDDSVRQAAVHALGRMGASAPPELFQKTLRDSSWQVREMALLTASESGIALPAALLEEALQDGSEPVRQAAREAREQMTRAQDTPSLLSHVVLTVGERKTPAMSQQSGPALMTPPPSSATRRRWYSPVKALALVATLLVTVGVLTAAGFGLGWWPSLLGDPAQYTTIGQEQTVNGVTVRLLKVYLDQGRSIVVYDILSPSADQRYVDGGTTLTSAYPHKNPGALPGGGVVKIDQHDARLTHEFTTYHPFATPADISTLAVTWTIEVAQPNETLPKTAPQSLSFTFTFTAPFHQVNNQQIGDPIKMGA